MKICSNNSSRTSNCTEKAYKNLLKCYYVESIKKTYTGPRFKVDILKKQRK